MTKQQAYAALSRRFDYLAARLADQPWLMGDSYSIADAYLFTILGWADYHSIELAKWPALTEYMGRVAARPAVQETLRAEGLTA